MLQQLRDIRERQRPCLEPCLRFLLSTNSTRKIRAVDLDDTASSSGDDEQPRNSQAKDFSVSLIRDHPNLAEPRSSQGVFGANGRLHFSLLSYLPN